MMTRPYSEDLCERVVAVMEAGESCRGVAACFGVAPSSAVKWRQRFMRTSSLRPNKMGEYRKPVLEEHRGWILERVRARPEATLKELQALLAARGVEVSHDTTASHSAP